MKKWFALAAMVFLLNGCMSYRGGNVSGDVAGNEASFGRGTSGVGSGADPGESITGSEFAPPRYH